MAAGELPQAWFLDTALPRPVPTVAPILSEDQFAELVGLLTRVIEGAVAKALAGQKENR